MNTTYNKFLIIFAVMLLFGGAYIYFSHDLEVHADTELASSALTSSDPSLGPGALSSNDRISQDTAFLYTLSSLTRIRIDTTLFDDTSFKSLNDNTVILEPSITGRPNPFAVVGANAKAGNAAISPVVTNIPSQITTKTAVLNGAISSNTAGVTSTFFEYGTTPTLGKVTPAVKQSLIGTFVTNVTGLTSGTTYFYHAVAKINGTLRYGDVISFTTN